jgi:hypothetical protein
VAAGLGAAARNSNFETRVVGAKPDRSVEPHNLIADISLPHDIAVHRQHQCRTVQGRAKLMCFTSRYRRQVLAQRATAAIS